jgi:hypothetical protein
MLASDQRLRIYQEVVRQIHHILISQPPEQFVESVQQLLAYLSNQGISTEEIQKKMISQVILKRAKQDLAFLEHLRRWEYAATDSARSSVMGEAVRFAIAML